MPRPVLIFDFDGTVALGDGPLLAYARAVAVHTASADDFVSAVAAQLAAPADGVIDGYDAVRRLALEADVDDTALAAAYTRSRTQLGGPDAPVSAAPGLADFLARVDAERLLVTNAPSTRLDEALSAMGLDALFDRIVTDAAKPAGLEALLDDLGDGVPVLTVGDVWRNDLAPAHARGLDTALVGGYLDPSATPTFRADTLDELLPALAAWVEAASVDAPPAAHLSSHA
ncbi:HAD family hydrolase [Microbacterium sp. SORGH_AS_0421]|uniref:HAD family hydrolase n=1 Tax=Microbacterium sp. SORGH_AS_0421 TaxID=3041768 RepID=UPI0027911106|nr:hydrolase [Microbacterium sp. SORGH_AS_0421]MDQ1175597.1 phosphoglycolate phosphatase-like HAD superfamily hydrolase [Microbacterium sp. SORGH_AS_0421]